MVEALLGLDVGTTTTKAVLYNPEGDELGRAVSPAYTNLTPGPGWVEQDPEELWQAVLTTIRDVMMQVGDNISVRGLCVAAQGGSLLAADARGKPVYRVITWMDGRTEKLVEDWRAAGYQETVRRVSGWSLYPGLCLPNIAWLRQNKPEIFKAAGHYFSVYDFIAYRLTGERVTNPSSAGGMQLVDIRTGRWSETLCDLAGIKPHNLSSIQPSGAPVGEILPEVVELTGLTSGVVLINGGHDQVCTALSLGVSQPGKFLLACGTAWVITGIVPNPDTTGLPTTLDLNFHALPQRWTLSQSLGGLGASVEWWLNRAWQGIGEAPSRAAMYAAFDRELEQTDLDPDLFFLPITGGHADPTTTGWGGFIGLQLSHTRADLGRSIMESAGYELRWALKAVERAGLYIDRLWMVGGGARSAHWPAILANITGYPIHLPQYDNWPALGAVVLAGMGCGLFESYERSLENFQKPAQTIEPDPALCVRYGSRYQAYKALVCRLKTQ
jgi:xylulokinase